MVEMECYSTWNGVINIKNKKWEFDFSPIDESASSWVDKYYSKHPILDTYLL